VNVILDTNVLLSGFYFGGVPGRILQAWSEGHVVLVLSPPILSEYREAGLQLETKYGPTHFDSFVSLLLVHAEMVDAPANLLTQVCSDPDDDKFLACALVSSAKVIVSGDRALLAVKEPLHRYGSEPGIS
jgi:putative PIN family toxin of toxin-antitoxin system